MRGGEAETSTLLRQIRLVPLRSPVASKELVDVRISDGVVALVATSLDPLANELVIEGGGRYAIPGLWDQHVHMLQWAQSRMRLDLRGTAGPEDVLRIVGEHLALLPAEEKATVFGFGHRSAVWSRRATVAELDAVSGQRPVVLVSGDGHNGWLNTAALGLLGLRGVAGALEENDWFPVFARLGEIAGSASDEDDLRRSVAEATTRGVVGVVDFEFGQGFLDWPARMARGIDQLRVRTATYSDRLDDVIAAGLRSGEPLPGCRGLAQMGPLKVIADGSLNTRTAYCCSPYADAGDSGMPRGQMNLSTDDWRYCSVAPDVMVWKSRCTPSATRRWRALSTLLRRRVRRVPLSMPSWSLDQTSRAWEGLESPPASSRRTSSMTAMWPIGSGGTGPIAVSR